MEIMDSCKSEKCQSSGCGTGQRQQARNDQDVAVKASLDRIKNKFIVMSGKGGVGKTSVSVNLSIALAARGFKVGIMDVDIHGPDVPRMLGIQGMLGVNGNRKLVPMAYSDNLGAVSIEALSASKDDAIIWRGPIKHSVIRQFVGDVEWGELDYLIIDAPPGTGDEPLTVSQVIPDAKAVIVTTPQEVALGDVRKSISFCKVVKMDVFGLVENMSGFSCPHCGEAVDLFGTGGGQRTAEEAGLNFLGRIPFDPNVVACGDTGTSFQEKYSESPVTLAFGEIAEKMSELVRAENKGASHTAGNGTMKFAIPIANGKLTAHFGHCKEFAIVNVEGKDVRHTEFLEPPPHEPGVLPKWLHEQNVSVVIAGGMGERAVGLFAENNIKVVTGAPPQAPEELVARYLNETLVTGANVCDH